MQVHRFRDRVAVSIGTGETVYLTTGDAGELAAAINRTKREIAKGVSFQDSKVGTFSKDPKPWR